MYVPLCFRPPRLHLDTKEGGGKVASDGKNLSPSYIEEKTSRMFDPYSMRPVALHNKLHIISPLASLHHRFLLKKEKKSLCELVYLDLVATSHPWFGFQIRNLQGFLSIPKSLTFYLGEADYLAFRCVAFALASSYYCL